MAVRRRMGGQIRVGAAAWRMSAPLTRLLMWGAMGKRKRKDYSATRQHLTRLLMWGAIGEVMTGEVMRAVRAADQKSVPPFGDVRSGWDTTPGRYPVCPKCSDTTARISTMAGRCPQTGSAGLACRHASSIALGCGGPAVSSTSPAAAVPCCGRPADDHGDPAEPPVHVAQERDECTRVGPAAHPKDPLSASGDRALHHDPPVAPTVCGAIHVARGPGKLDHGTNSCSSVHVNPPMAPTGKTAQGYLTGCTSAQTRMTSMARRSWRSFPVATNTGRWRRFVFGRVTAICFLHDTRPKFLVNGCEGGNGAPMACAMLCYGGRHARFLEVFGEHGAVVNIAHMGRGPAPALPLGVPPGRPCATLGFALPPTWRPGPCPRCPWAESGLARRVPPWAWSVLGTAPPAHPHKAHVTRHRHYYILTM